MYAYPTRTISRLACRATVTEGLTQPGWQVHPGCCASQGTDDDMPQDLTTVARPALRAAVADAGSGLGMMAHQAGTSCRGLSPCSSIGSISSGPRDAPRPVLLTAVETART